MQIGQNHMKNLVKYYLTKQNRMKNLYGIGFLLLILSIVTGIMIGSSYISLNDIIKAFTYGADYSAATKIFTYIRLPRTIASILCGSALAVSGVIIQAVLANQLASPGIIGVNSGAGLLVTLCTALGIYSGWQISVGAFIGAFSAVMIINVASRKLGASRSTVILLGVALNSLLGAISDAVITFVPDVGVMSNNFKVGEFSAVTYQSLIPVSIIILITIVIVLTMTNELDILTLGEDNAKALGMNTSFSRTLFLVLAALLAGCAVSIAGLLSFVGLVVPHMVRRIAGSKSIHLTVLSVLFGGSFVCFCDTLARTVFSPYEIPVGIIMSFLGVPFFVFILIKGKGGHRND